MCRDGTPACNIIVGVLGRAAIGRIVGVVGVAVTGMHIAYITWALLVSVCTPVAVIVAVVQI